MTTPTQFLTCLVALVASLGMSARAQRQLPPPELTEIWEPVPAVVSPTHGHRPPSDAVMLFNGTDLSEWRGRDGEPQWDVKDGIMTVRPGTGDLTTKRTFGNMQLHLEWRTPTKIVGEGQGRGNSGVFLMERYEVQVLDSWHNATYVNGQAASLYKQHPPLVNASKRPGEWQTYDIIFTAPRFRGDGSVQRPATVTVIHNGVVVQNHTTVTGQTAFRGAPYYEAHASSMPLMLQDHRNLVSYRNIWVRELSVPTD